MGYREISYRNKYLSISCLLFQRGLSKLRYKSNFSTLDFPLLNHCQVAHSNAITTLLNYFNNLKWSMKKYFRKSMAQVFLEKASLNFGVVRSNNQSTQFCKYLCIIFYRKKWSCIAKIKNQICYLIPEMHFRNIDALLSEISDREESFCMVMLIQTRKR